MKQINLNVQASFENYFQNTSNWVKSLFIECRTYISDNGEFDPGSGRTLAVCLIHASRTIRSFGIHKWRTGEYNIGNLPLGGGQQRETSANTPYERTWNGILENSGAKGWVCIWLASWRCNGPPRRRSVAGLRGWSATMGLRHGPYSYGRQQ